MNLQQPQEPNPPQDTIPKKLDLSHLSPPLKLEEVVLEEITIDGICGVY